MLNRRTNRRNRLLLLLGLVTISLIVATVFGYFAFGNGNPPDWLTQSGIQLPSWRLPFSSEEDELGTADSGSLLVYSNLPEDLLINYIGVFRADHPDIEIAYELIDAAELSERLVAEKENPQADLVWGVSATTLIFLDWRNTLTPYIPAGLEKIPAKFQDSFHPPVWVGQSAYMNAFCINDKLLADAGVPIPRSWLELADPAYEEMIIMPDPRQSSVGYMTLLVFVDLLGEGTLWQFYDKLDQNVIDYSQSEAVCQDVADGAAPIGVSFGLDAIDVRNRGGAIEVVFPIEGSGWDMEASALTRKLPVKPAAKTLMDFIISEEAMHEYAQSYAVTAIKLDYIPVPSGYPENPEIQLRDKDFEWAGANRTRLLHEWGQRYAR
jgi:iron(III) transport system substrate-binding protein